MRGRRISAAMLSHFFSLGLSCTRILCIAVRKLESHGQSGCFSFLVRPIILDAIHDVRKSFVFF